MAYVKPFSSDIIDNPFIYLQISFLWSDISSNKSNGWAICSLLLIWGIQLISIERGTIRSISFGISSSSDDFFFKNEYPLGVDA